MLREIWLLFSLHQSLTHATQLAERRVKYQAARDQADIVGKPLLVVGRPKFSINHPCGDVTLDLDPRVQTECPNGIVADVRDMPFPDGYFGAAVCEHVLEHLGSIADVQLAWQELHRVAETVFIAGPRKYSALAWFIPGHYLWVWQLDDGTLYVQSRATGEQVILSNPV